MTPFSFYQKVWIVFLKNELDYLMRVAISKLNTRLGKEKDLQVLGSIWSPLTKMETIQNCGLTKISTVSQLEELLVTAVNTMQTREKL